MRRMLFPRATSACSLSFFSCCCFLLSILRVSDALLQPSAFFGATNRDAYLDWVAASAPRTNYTHVRYLPATADAGSAIHWSIDASTSTLHLAVAARATGWVGFGLAEGGTMPGSDMVLYTAATDRVVDAYVLEQLQPIPDDNCQDWTLVSSQTYGGFLIFEVTRLLDTGDPQDRVIVNDAEALVLPHRIISAWGDTAQVLYHGPQNRVRSAVRFFGDPTVDELGFFQETMATAAEGTFDVRMSDYPVKTIPTEYAYSCVSYADLQAQGVPANVPLHVVGIEPIIDGDAARFVHHFTVFGSTSDIRPGEECVTGPQWIEMAYVWAPGEGPFAFPANVGGPIGPGGFLAYQLEVHYDNQLGISGGIDSSGVRFHYTTQRREHDMGVLQLGDPFVLLKPKFVGTEEGGLVKHTFDCPGSCSTSIFGATPAVTVVREYLHMHMTGAAMVNEQIRNGQVIRTGAVEFWDFNSQGNAGIRQNEFEIQRGDGFRTTCFYSPGGDTRFGLASTEEMCIAFLFYFPRQTIFGVAPYLCGYSELPFCSADWTKEAVSDVMELGRAFGNVSDTCDMEESTPAPVVVPNQGSLPPSVAPSVGPTRAPTQLLSAAPSDAVTATPSHLRSEAPSPLSSGAPSEQPTIAPTFASTDLLPVTSGTVRNGLSWGMSLCAIVLVYL